jgi:hypothetical protein
VTSVPVKIAFRCIPAESANKPLIQGVRFAPIAGPI